MAVDEWANIEQDSSVNLERALTAFDMFVLSDRAEDFDYVSQKKHRHTSSGN